MRKSTRRQVAFNRLIVEKGGVPNEEDQRPQGRAGATDQRRSRPLQPWLQRPRVGPDGEDPSLEEGNRPIVRCDVTLGWLGIAPADGNRSTAPARFRDRRPTRPRHQPNLLVAPNGGVWSNNPAVPLVVGH